MAKAFLGGEVVAKPADAHMKAFQQGFSVVLLD
jgi:hypothetical protein